MILHQRPLGEKYDILALANSTVLTTDTILCCTNNPLPKWRYSFRFPWKKII